MLENLNSYLDDPVDGNRQDDEVEIDLLEIFYVSAESLQRLQ